MNRRCARKKKGRKSTKTGSEKQNMTCGGVNFKMRQEISKPKILTNFHLLKLTLDAPLGLNYDCDSIQTWRES